MHVRRIRFLYVKEYVLSSVIASLLNHSILNKVVEKSVIEDSEDYFIHWIFFHAILIYHKNLQNIEWNNFKMFKNYEKKNISFIKNNQ